MKKILDILPKDASDKTRAYAYDMAIHQALRQGDELEARRIAQMLMPLWDELLMGTPAGEERQAAYVRLCFHAILAEAKPRGYDSEDIEKPWSQELLVAAQGAAHALALGDEQLLSLSLTTLDGLRQRQAQEEGPWLDQAPNARGAAMYLVGLYHTVAGLHRMVQLALGEDVEPSTEDPTLTPAELIHKHWEHVDSMDGMLGGPSALTQMPRVETIAALEL